MSDLPFVSILMCSYNAWEYVAHTITSVLQQSYDNFELLILDNNSSDTTVSVIKSFADKRINLVESKTNIWPYWWLNKLLAQAKGDYIAIQDHDDLWHPQKLEKQVSFLEKNHKYIWCGTKTLMRYEWDQKWFEYFLGKENYYTIHPSLLFRNQGFRYPEDRIYMNDAYFQKMVLCHWKKLIYNIDQTLTIHRIKSWAENYSYKRFQYTKKNVQTLFALHPWWYACVALFREWLRKLLYPIVQRTWRGSWIDRLERIPFRLMGYKIWLYNKKEVEKLWFIGKL